MKIEKPGLLKDKTPAGNIRWRVRIEGDKKKRITIPVGPEHPDFEEHYAAARQGRQLKRGRVDKPTRGSLDELCERFIHWIEGQVDAANPSQLTLNSRRMGLTQACDCLSPRGQRMGTLRAGMPKDAFAHIRDSFGARTGAAETCLKALRAAYTWGEDHGYPAESSVFSIRSKHRSKGGATPWTDTDEEKFLRSHGPGTMARRWFLLARNTAGRIGDTHLLGSRNEVFKNDRQYLAWQPGKRGSKPVQLPMARDLMVELAGHPLSAPAYLLTEYGRPFASSGSLDNRIRKWVVAAGLVGSNGKANRSQHGIRKRRAEQITEASGSVFEVMAHLAISEPRTAAIYTAKVERARLAEAAADRAERAVVGQCVPRPDHRGTPGPQKFNEQRGKEARWQPVGESNPSFQVENLAS